jgi:hypothetical protein
MKIIENHKNKVLNWMPFQCKYIFINVSVTNYISILLWSS